MRADDNARKSSEVRKPPSAAAVLALASVAAIACHRSPPSTRDALTQYLSSWSSVGPAVIPEGALDGAFTYRCRLFADGDAVETLSRDDVRIFHEEISNRGVLELKLGKARQKARNVWDVPFSGIAVIPLDAKVLRGQFRVSGRWRIHTVATQHGAVVARVDESIACGGRCNARRTPASLCLAQYLVLDKSRVTYQPGRHRPPVPTTALAAVETRTGAVKYFYDHPQFDGPAGVAGARVERVRLFDPDGREVAGFELD